MGQSSQSRMTRQRKVILEEVKKLKTHPTADDIFAIARKRLPKISLGTVYRNLDVLAGLGQIVRLDTAGGPSRFDGTTQRHYHIRCVECGRLDDLEGVAILIPEAEVQGASDYEIVDHFLEFHGVCPACGRQGARPGAGGGGDRSGLPRKRPRTQQRPMRSKHM